jgi:hypothetical protein
MDRAAAESSEEALETGEDLRGGEVRKYSEDREGLSAAGLALVCAEVDARTDDWTNAAVPVALEQESDQAAGVLTVDGGVHMVLDDLLAQAAAEAVRVLPNVSLVVEDQPREGHRGRVEGRGSHQLADIGLVRGGRADDVASLGAPDELHDARAGDDDGHQRLRFVMGGVGPGEVGEGHIAAHALGLRLHVQVPDPRQLVLELGRAHVP